MTQVETNIFVRPLSGDDIPLMETFLYEAIFVPAGVTKPPREIVKQSELVMVCRILVRAVGITALFVSWRTLLLVWRGRASWRIMAISTTPHLRLRSLCCLSIVDAESAQHY